MAPDRKDFAGEVFVPRYFTERVEFVPLLKESQNGLESTEDRRSAGRHGNQYVCLRRPQVGDRRSARFYRSDAGSGRALRDPQTGLRKPRTTRFCVKVSIGLTRGRFMLRIVVLGAA